MTDLNYLIRGVGGSNAHGLAHEGSDHDYRGVFAYPTEALLGLDEPPETIVTAAPQPDSSAHELKKFLRLAMKANPDVLEVLALDMYIDFDDDWGPRLLELTPAFLSSTYVHSAYMGYASQQFHALEKRGDSFSSKTKGRTWKHAKHMFRLMEVGMHLYTTGDLKIKVNSPSWYLETLPEMEIQDAIAEFDMRFEAFRHAETVLPKQPDVERINQFLIDYRKAH